MFQQPEKEKTVNKALKQVIVTIQDKKYICYRSCPNLKKVSVTYEGHKALFYPTMKEKGGLIEIHFNTLEHNYLLKKNLARTNKHMRKQQRKEILKTKSTNGLTKKMNKHIDNISNKLRMSRETESHLKTVIKKQKTFCKNKDHYFQAQTDVTNNLINCLQTDLNLTKQTCKN